MKTVAEKIRELKEKEGQIKGMGGAKAVEKQRASGKLTARERLDLFFDPGTFRETDIFVTHRCVNFGMEQVEIPADGVVTGFGKVNGRPVFAFAQDFTSRAGSLGEMHSKKICKVMDLALKAGVPFVGFNDSGGARIQEGVDSSERLRADFLPQRHRQRRHPPDLRHHGTHRRGRGLLPGHDGLHLHGEEHLATCSSPGPTSSRASPGRRSASRPWAAPWPTTPSPGWPTSPASPTPTPSTRSSGC